MAVRPMDFRIRTSRFNWQPLKRTSDHFFVKYGYLFRM